MLNFMIYNVVLGILTICLIMLIMGYSITLVLAHSKKQCVSPMTNYVTALPSPVNDPVEPHRITVKNPEKRVFDEHTDHETMRNLNILDNKIGSDPLLIKQTETTGDQLMRSLVLANTDGAQMEGMSAPIDEFERSAMVMQMKAKPDIYGELSVGYSSSADMISNANI